MARRTVHKAVPSSEEAVPLEQQFPIVINVRIRVSWDNMLEFKDAWERQYLDQLREYAYIETAEMVIPPRAEAETVQLA